MKTTRLVMLAMVAVLASGLADGVTGSVEQETPLYAEQAAVVAVVRMGGSVELIEAKGKWCKVRVQIGGGEHVEGLVAVGAFVKRGDGLEALRDWTPVYATSRAVLATLPPGASVEVLRIVGKGYMVRYTPDGGAAINGLIAIAAIEETDEIIAWREQLAAAAAERIKAAAEAQEFEALYEQWKHKYALVGKKYVRLPDFDLRYPSSASPRDLEDKEVVDGFGRVTVYKRNPRNLPRLRVGEFGYISTVEVVQVLGPQSFLGQAGVSERLILFTGWPTAGVVDNSTFWHGRSPGGLRVYPKEHFLAIIGTYTFKGSPGRRRTVLHAIPLEQVKKGLTQQQFREFLPQLEREKE